MQNQLEIIFSDNLEKDESIKSPQFQFRTTTFAASDVTLATISDYVLLTNENDRKVYHLKFTREEIPFDYQAGDTIGILPSNRTKEVDEIILRLGLENVADKPYELRINPNNQKKKKSIPKHIPPFGTLKKVLTHNVNLHGVPKKSFLKILLEHTKDEEERDKLTLLCSPKNSVEYEDLISCHNKRNLLSLLKTFSSCNPPIEVLLEHLPPLLPRAYSISSSPLNEKYLSITFNVDNDNGLCSTWLEDRIKEFKATNFCTIPIYLRLTSKFVLPEDKSVPIVLIGTGTGISPFRSFLEDRYLQNDIVQSKSWLFYGCRDSSNNYLFKEDLKSYLASGVLSKLTECFSRGIEGKKYVQDAIEESWDDLGSWIVDDESVLYVCGDFHKVLPSVRIAILNVLSKIKSTEEETELYLKNMELEGRYITESWY